SSTVRDQRAADVRPCRARARCATGRAHARPGAGRARRCYDPRRGRRMDHVIAACKQALARQGAVIALTGAGVSAESGIPTFRGKEGYWTIGAREYHPQELATRAAFDAMPWQVWAWYLYRRGVCRTAEPNAGHRALVAWDGALGDRFALVTQNVDGLHRRAGSPDARLHEIHGAIDLMRCSRDCTAARYPIAGDVPAIARGADVPAEV